MTAIMRGDHSRRFAGSGADPGLGAERSEALELAVLVLLGRPSPTERTYAMRALAKIEWLKDREEKPYGVTVPGTQTEMSFMVKDAKRFPDTNGWGYATFQYDASSDTFKPSTTNPSFARTCHGCHTANAKARDFVFTDYAKR